jgi:hypothetical protein
MRARKEVLLVMPNEFELSIWKLKLEVWGYRVSAYQQVDEALEHLRVFPVDGCATNLRAAAKALHARKSEVLLFGLKPNAENFTLTRFVPECTEVAACVREALKVMMARKRGPKAGQALHAADALRAGKPVQSVAADKVLQRRA